MDQEEFNYDTASDTEINRQLYYANMGFNADKLFSKTDEISYPSITVITTTQKISVTFMDKQIKSKHAGMTDIMLSRIYPNYVRAKEDVSMDIYFNNKENNVYILTGNDMVTMFLPQDGYINETQYNYIYEFMMGIKNSLFVQMGGDIKFFFNSDMFGVKELDEKLEDLKNNIKVKIVPEQIDMNIIWDSFKEKNKQDFFGQMELNVGLQEEAEQWVHNELTERSNEQMH